MKPIERRDLYHMLNGLSNKINDIAEEVDDFDAADQLHELAEKIDDSADKLLAAK